MNDRPQVRPLPPFEVHVSDTQKHLTVDPAWVSDIVLATLLSEDVPGASISVALMNDAAIRVINAQHLAHDWATDVISFRLDDADEDQMVGELVVSAETAVKMASQLGTKPNHELALYLVHGLHHLCGYDDQTPDDVAIIRRREVELLEQLGFPSLPARAADSASVAADPHGESMSWPL